MGIRREFQFFLQLLAQSFEHFLNKMKFLFKAFTELFFKIRVCLSEPVLLDPLVNSDQISSATKLSEMNEIEISSLFEFLVSWHRLSVSFLHFRWANDEYVVSLVLVDVLIKGLSIIEVAKHQSKVPVPAVYRLQEEF